MSDEVGGRRRRVGFIGLGQIGGPMAARLAGWPGRLIVHDARPAAMTPLADAGATAALARSRGGGLRRLGRGSVSVMVRAATAHGPARGRPAGRGVARARRASADHRHPLHDRARTPLPALAADFGRRRHRGDRRAGQRRLHGRAGRAARGHGGRLARRPTTGAASRSAALPTSSCTWARSAPGPGPSLPATCCTSSRSPRRPRRSGWPRRRAWTCASSPGSCGIPTRSPAAPGRSCCGRPPRRWTRATRCGRFWSMSGRWARRTCRLALELGAQLGVDLPLARVRARQLRRRARPARRRRQLAAQEGARHDR